MQVKIQRIDGERTSRVVTFEQSDEKGRVIGARVQLWICEEREYTGESEWGWAYGDSSELGSYFVMMGNATRNGKDYGASGPRRMFRTEAEREAAIAEYLKGARARARKHRSR